MGRYSRCRAELASLEIAARPHRIAQDDLIHVGGHVRNGSDLQPHPLIALVDLVDDADLAQGVQVGGHPVERGRGRDRAGMVAVGRQAEVENTGRHGLELLE